MDHQNLTLNTIGRVEKAYWDDIKEAVLYEGWVKHPEVAERIDDKRLQHTSIGALIKNLVEEKSEEKDIPAKKVAVGMEAVELSTTPIPGVAGASIDSDNDDMDMEESESEHMDHDG